MPLVLTLLMTALMAQQGSSFYDLKTQTLVGNKPADLGAYRGKVTLVVNVASYCGYTPQYKGLEKLHRELAAEGLCRARVSEQRLRRAGAGQRREDRRLLPAHLRRHLPDVREGGDEGRAGAVADLRAPRRRSGHLPAWNFAKYLIGKDGQVIAFFPSDVTPESPAAARGDRQGPRRA